MKWLYKLLLIFCLMAFTKQVAFADSYKLFGEIEHNQLLDTLMGKTNTINCPFKASYAQAINQLLKGYGLSNILQSSVQKNNAASVLKTQAGVKTLDPSVKAAHTIQDVLANHNLSIIIDRSGSMATQDCPGGLSRWQWCSQQVFQLADAAAKASSSVTVMFFNSDLQIFDNVNPKNLPQLFRSYYPAGGTLLGAPLVAQLDRYFSQRLKPLIIVVITDGIPQDTMDLAPLVRDASDSLHYAGEVTISFLLVGNQVNADEFKRLIGELDGGTIKNGGMVDVIGYKQLENQGVKQTLFEELKTITLKTNKSVPSRAEKFAAGRSLAAPLSASAFPNYYKNSNAVAAVYQASSATNPFPAYSIEAASTTKPNKINLANKNSR